MNIDYSPLSLVGQKITYKMIWRDKARRIYVKWMGYGSLAGVAAVFLISSKNQLSFLSCLSYAGFSIFIVTPLVMMIVKMAYTSGIEAMYLGRFIELNGFKKLSSIDADEPGLIFKEVDKVINVDGFEVDKATLPIRIFDYTGQKKRSLVDRAVSKQEYDWLYCTAIRIQLSHQLPNIVIGNKVNDGKGIFKQRDLNQAWLNRHQKLHLEGDFDKTFTVYVPSGYETDALYVLTPELMQIMLDHGSDYDFEIVDNYLYMTHMYITKFTAQKTKYMIDLAIYFSAQFEQNTRRYQNDRPSKAGQNLRLK